jgi:hypothetical protein
MGALNSGDPAFLGMFDDGVVFTERESLPLLERTRKLVSGTWHFARSQAHRRRVG